MKERSLKKRFRYWLDRRMAKGTSGMVKLLVTTVLGSVLIVSLLVLAFGLHKDGKSFLAIFWTTSGRPCRRPSPPQNQADCFT